MKNSIGPARYSLKNLVSQARSHVGPLTRHRKRLVPGFVGPERLDGKTRLLIQLRMARLVGCPVCVGLFPMLALPAGLTPGAVSSAVAGEPEHLSDEQYGAVSWAGEVIRNEGQAPHEVPEAALVLNETQRGHIAYMMRLELLVHATGLMFLPHQMVARVRGY